MAPRLISWPVVGTIVLLSAAATAQEAVLQPPPQSAPTPVATPAPIPAPMPTSSAVPATLPTPTLSPRPGIDDATTPVFVPNARATLTPPKPVAVPSPTPTATASPLPIATPIPSPTPASAAPRQPIETVILPQQRPALPIWAWALGAVALAMIAIGWLALRRHRPDWIEEAGGEGGAIEEGVDDLTVDPRPAATPSVNQAKLRATVRPTRAGVNLISATADCDVTLVNVGKAAATDIRATLRLMSARDGQNAELAEFYRDVAGRPATAAFALAPGEERRFRVIAALPHDAIHVIEAGGRPMFVPLLALAVHYRDGEGGGEARLGQSFALGIERPGSAKLAPLWLDGPARHYDNVAARPHGEPSKVSRRSAARCAQDFDPAAQG